MQNFHLAQTHRIQRSIVRLRRDARAECRVNHNIRLRKCRLAQHGVGNHANAGAYADKFNFRRRFRQRAEHVRQGHRAERRLADDAGRRNAVHSSSNGIVQCMTFRSFDAVRHRQMTPFVCLHIVRLVGVQRDKQVLTRCIFCLLCHIGHDSARFSRTERAADKILLHIHYDKNFHKLRFSFV